MSPGTSSSIGISRRRVAGVLSGRIRRRRAPPRCSCEPARATPAALLDRDSCANRRPVLRSTINPMTTTAFSSPVTPETTASVVTRMLNGLANACASWAYQVGGFSCDTSLRPNCARRRSHLLVEQTGAARVERRECGVRSKILRELDESLVGLRAVSSAAVLGLCGRAAGRGARNARGHVDSRDYGGLGMRRRLPATVVSRTAGSLGSSGLRSTGRER